MAKDMQEYVQDLRDRKQVTLGTEAEAEKQHKKQ